MAELRILDLDTILGGIRQAVMTSQSEEDVRVKVSSIIEDKILIPLGIKQVGKYEYTLISGARVDALYGHVIIEYKAPGKLSSKSEIIKAKQQLIKYISEEANNIEERFRNFIGIIISDRIAFLRYNPRAEGDKWILRGPYDINRETSIKLVEALRGLQRKRLDVDSLVRDFGPQSDVARKFVRMLYERLRKSKSVRVRVLFDDWLRLFSQTTGYSPDKLRELKEIVKEYGLKGNVDYNALLFSLHTYYGFIMKLLAAEIAYLYGGGKWLKSYVGELESAYLSGGVEGLKFILKELEEGGVFSRLLNIVNFIEGDYFSWYLDVLDGELGDVIAEVARRFGDYEPATPHLEPETTRDLLKRLYQSLIPRDVRHKLGEFYTPDWLAELLLNEVGLTLESFEEMSSENPLRPLELRVLDPACGSGTFLVLYLKRLREYAENHYLIDQLIEYVLSNVVGFDLNPLAVLAARTNYLLAIGDLLTYAKGRVEIPVYLADSILIESKADLRGHKYSLRTSVRIFEIPQSVVEGGFLQDVLVDIDRAIRNRYSVGEFVEYIRGKYGLGEIDVDFLSKLYEAFLKLEIEGKNHVWISIIRNAFAPILKGKFDYVVGNPPWINWDNLPESYRDVSKELWSMYGLTKIRGGMGLGKVKRDMAMLFFVRCFDLYLKNGGVHGFLVPFTLFKTQAGAGFRRKIAESSKIVVIHDLVTLYPFEGPVNRTAALVAQKTDATSNVRRQLEFKHVVWINKRGRPIPINASLDEVLHMTERHEMLIVPIEANDAASPWMQTKPKALKAIRKVLGVSEYRAFEGINTAFNQIYYIRIVDKDRDGKLIITNPPESGQKKSVRQVTAKIEQDLVYPLIRGRDVKKWYVEFNDRYVIVPHDSRSGRPLLENKIKIHRPLTYEYLMNYRRELEGRSIHKLWGKDNPFYSLYDIGPYTFAPYKVVWKNIAGAITGKAVDFVCAVMEPVNDNFLGKTVIIPNVKLMLVPLQDSDEAHYLCGILNSTIVRAIAASYMVEVEIGTHILDHISVKQFDRNNGLHVKISSLSRKAHELSKSIYSGSSSSKIEELYLVEEILDKTVAELYGITNEELVEIKKLYSILAGKEIK